VDVVKDKQTGEIMELHCIYDPTTKGGDSPDGRKVKGTLHWVSAAHAIKAEVRLYESLFLKEDPEEDEDFKSNINSDSLAVLNNCQIEPGLAKTKKGEIFQFERKGYFCVDPDSTEDKSVFNRSVSLRDTWAKIEKKQK